MIGINSSLQQHSNNSILLSNFSYFSDELKTEKHMKTQPININVVREYARDLFMNYDRPSGVQLTDRRLIAGNKAFALLLFIQTDTAARIDDLLSFKWDDITQYKDRPLITWIMKKTSKERTAWLTSETEMYLEKYANWLLDFYDNVDDLNDYIFHNYSTNKGRYTRIWAYQRMKALNASGRLGSVKKVVGTHSVRKASAHDVYNKTKDLRLVKEHLGHSNIATTSKYLGIQQEEYLDAMLKVVH